MASVDGMMMVIDGGNFGVWDGVFFCCVDRCFGGYLGTWVKTSFVLPT